jgi:actin-related protein
MIIIILKGCVLMIKDDNAPIVLDNGSGNSKVGFSGDDDPKYSIKTVVGTPLYNIGMVEK